MNEIKAQSKRKHDISIKSRKTMSIDGVEDVVSFDEFQVVLITTCGEMTVEGTELHIKVLELGEGVVELDGNIDSVAYSDGKADENNEKSIFAKLFR